MDIVEALRACFEFGGPGMEPDRTRLEELADRWGRRALQEPVVTGLGVFWAPVTGEPGARWPVCAYRLHQGDEARVMLAWPLAGGAWRGKVLKRREVGLPVATPPAVIGELPTSRR